MGEKSLHNIPEAINSMYFGFRCSIYRITNLKLKRHQHTAVQVKEMNVTVENLRLLTEAVAAESKINYLYLQYGFTRVTDSALPSLGVSSEEKKLSKCWF